MTVRIDYCKGCKVHFLPLPQHANHTECVYKRNSVVTPAVRDYLSVMDSIKVKASKEAISVGIFTVLQDNPWFIQAYPRFAYTVIKKVNEFAFLDEEHISREENHRMFNYVLMNNQCRYVPEPAKVDIYDVPF